MQHSPVRRRLPSPIRIVDPCQLGQGRLLRVESVLPVVAICTAQVEAQRRRQRQAVSAQLDDEVGVPQPNLKSVVRCDRVALRADVGAYGERLAEEHQRLVDEVTAQIEQCTAAGRGILLPQSIGG